MQHAAFDPTDANRVWATGPSSGTQTTWLSTNGGASWTQDDAGINNVVSQIAVDSDGTAYTGQFTMWRRGKAEGTWSSMSLTQQVRAIALRTAGQPFVAYGVDPLLPHALHEWSRVARRVAHLAQPRLDLRDDVRIRRHALEGHGHCPGPGPGPGGDNLALGASRLGGTWAVSKLKGTLRVAGTLGAAASVRVRLYDKANRVQLNRRLALPAGAFTRTLALPATLLPGRYRLELLAGTERETANLTLAAPKQGVADRAFVSALRGGPPATTLSARRHQLWARFRFAALPTRGAATVRWFGPRGAVGRAVGKPRERTIDAFVNAGANLPAGAWRCELRVGGVLVAVARVRLNG